MFDFIAEVELVEWTVILIAIMFACIVYMVYSHADETNANFELLHELLRDSNSVLDTDKGTITKITAMYEFKQKELDDMTAERDLLKKKLASAKVKERRKPRAKQVTSKDKAAVKPKAKSPRKKQSSTQHDIV